ncbi:MAG: SoxR reducing system RseC family protein [Candidatus Omnitrophica bacterium]|nr:SoxR reducing system RseC family protein [Candidatus Omnitrophota bacterium]
MKVKAEDGERKSVKQVISLDTCVSNGKIQDMGVSEHTAVVRELKGQRVGIELVRAELPLSFRSKSVLSIGSVSKVIVEVDCQGRDMKPGDHVIVLLEEQRRIGWSVFWVSVVPILVFGLFYNAFYFLTKDFRIAVIGAGVLIFPYYSFLWLLRDDWSRTFIFRLK